MRIELLQSQINEAAHGAEQGVANQKAIKLMAVNRQVALAFVLPDVLLVHLYAHQVGEHVGQALVMIPLDPDDLHVAFGVRKLANVGEELPVVLPEPGKIQVAENVAQQDELIEARVLQHAERICGPAGFGAQVQVGNDQRVAVCVGHCPISSAAVLRGDEAEVKF